MTTSLAREGADLHGKEGAGMDATGDFMPLFHRLLLARRLDERLATAVRQGALEHWKSGGAEGALIGAASVLEERDWLFAGAMDLAGALARGVPLAILIAHVFAAADDPERGRVPAPRLALRMPPLGSYGFHNGAHLTHAAGVAWAAKIKKEHAVALAFFDGDEVTSGEFHNAMNFAGVFRVPAVFVATRRASNEKEPIAARAVAYGLPSASCDGGDVLEVQRTVLAAVERARRGEGATIVEAIARADAPLGDVVRLERTLAARGLEREVQSVRQSVEREIEEAFAKPLTASHPLSTIFEDVYAAAPPHLAAQRDQALQTKRS